jgi:hypothetical protein
MSAVRKMTLFGRVFPGIITASALGLLAPSPALGQEAEAASLFRAGAAAYERGDFRAAAVAFEDAHRRAPRAATIYNAALAWQAAGELGRAADAFEACIAYGGLEASSLEDARSRLRALDPELGVVRVTGPDGYKGSIAYVEDAALPRRVRLRPGSYEVRANGPDGNVLTRSVEVKAGTSVEVSFEPPPAALAPSSPEPQRTIGWITLGTGVAFGLLTAGLGVAALDARDLYLHSGNTDLDARSSADRLRTWTNVSLVAAAVCAGAGVTLILTAPKARPSAAGSLVIGPTSLAYARGF